jgi:hypothetical protein
MCQVSAFFFFWQGWGACKTSKCREQGSGPAGLRLPDTSSWHMCPVRGSTAWSGQAGWMERGNVKAGRTEEGCTPRPRDSLMENVGLRIYAVGA